MSVSELRSKVRAIILGITGLLIAFLFARVVLDLISADRANPFVQFIKEISDLLSEPFESLASNESGLDNLNVDALVSIFMYFIIGLILSEIITSFIYDNLEDIIQNFVDAIFKILEFILFLRIIFDFFEVNPNAKFLGAIYDLTNWTNGILNIEILNGRINFSVIIILVIIIIFDILTESLLRSIFKTSNRKEVRMNSGSTSTNHNITIAPVPTNPYIQQTQPMHPIRQNITVNIPAPQPRTQTTIIQPSGPMAATIPTWTPTATINPPQNYQRFTPANATVTTRATRKQSGFGSKVKKFFGS